MQSVIERDRQKLEALRRANVIRDDRKQLKSEIRAHRRQGALVVADVLLDNPQRVASMDIGDLLLLVPHLGKGAIRVRLEGWHLSPWREVGTLTFRQRTMIAGRLVAFANKRPL